MDINKARQLLSTEYPKCVIQFKEKLKGTWLEEGCDEFISRYGEGMFLLMALCDNELEEKLTDDEKK
jgi:hypothetical protein